MHITQQRDSVQTQNGRWIVITTIALMSIFLIYLYLVQPAMRNNGDYYRVVGAMIEAPFGSLEKTCHDIKTTRIIPLSTMGVIFYLSTVIQKILGASCITENSTFAILAVIYLLGLYLYLSQSANKIIAAITSVIPIAIFHPFLKSYYEEAALFALLPWLSLGTLELMQHGRFKVFVFSSALFVFAKVQMVVFIPLLLFFVGYRYWQEKNFLKESLIAVAIIIAAALVAHIGKGETHKPNSYNRMFNGVGWALQDVSNWPAHDFVTRHRYWSSNQDQLQQKTMDHEPIPGHKLIGSSYWPTGIEILKLHAPDKQLKEELLATIQMKNYLALLTSSNHLALTMAKEVYRVFAESDYSISYLRTAPADTSLINDMTVQVARRFGWIYLALSPLLLFQSGVLPKVIMGGLYLLLPAVVVFGDGFYEFEKHMVPYFASIPLFFMLLQDKNRKIMAVRSTTPSHMQEATAS